MLCSKIGGQCPHTVQFNPNFVFVIMPFRDSKNIYDAIQQAVEGLHDKELVCKRADDEYTNLSIWCKNICTNIRRAKYLVVDTTGRNPNVFYELGFAHSLDETKAILITQNVKEAPFDIADLNHIVYNKENLRELREKLQGAILSLENEKRPQISTQRSSDESSPKLHEGIAAIEKILKEMKEKNISTQSSSTDRLINKLPMNDEQRKTEAQKWFDKGSEEFNRRNYFRAIDYLSKTIEFDPKYDNVYNNMGLAYYKTNDFDNALVNFNRAIELNPEDAGAIGNRGIIFHKQKEYNKALKDYSRSIELKPENSMPYVNRGITHDVLRNYPKALSDYNYAIKLNPLDSSVYHNRGITYHNLKEYDKALADYNKAIELDSYYLDAYRSRELTFRTIEKEQEN